MERVWHKPIIEDLGAPTEYHRKLILHDLPAPLVPPEINLRDYPSMMVDVERWRDSDFVLTAPAEIYRYASLLWLAAWHQIPAGSLPNDESLLKVLAKHSGNFRGFRRMLPEILHGFIECSDGRLYHPVVAEKALAAWESKQKQRARTEAARNAPLKATQGSRPVTDHEHNNKDLQSSRPVTASKRSKVKGREEKEEFKPTESSFSFADDPPKEVAANAAPKKERAASPVMPVSQTAVHTITAVLRSRAPSRSKLIAYSRASTASTQIFNGTSFVLTTNRKAPSPKIGPQNLKNGF